MGGFTLLERFILTLRKDIGNENSQLKDGDLLRLFITDYDASIGKQSALPPVATPDNTAS